MEYSIRLRKFDTDCSRCGIGINGEFGGLKQKLRGACCVAVGDATY
jgi:hypothetical protein